MAHTPGPWTIRETMHDIEIRSEAHFVTVAAMPFKTLTDQESLDAARDDARLIAAAPDLLVACRSAKAWLEYCDMADTAQHARLTDAIKKAIGA